jgi:hypothetical protein
MNIQCFWRIPAAAALLVLLAACAHPIVVSPLDTPLRVESKLSPKKAAYVLTEADRNLEVTTPGGGGDKVSYKPYRDLEKAIRDALRAVYSDVIAVNSASDREAFRAHGVSHVFSPRITTTSDSPSAFTWPPTKFGIEMTSQVSDPSGAAITTIRTQSNGAAEFDEFKHDFSLSARRAATQLSEQFQKQVAADPLLR